MKKLSDKSISLYTKIQKSVIHTDITESTETGNSRREELIQSNQKLIEGLERRLKPKRFVPHDGDLQKQGYIRLLIQALKVQNEILKDVEIDDLKRDIEELRDLMKCK